MATKSDKLSARERSRQIQKIKQAFYREEDSEKLIVYSSKNNQGRKELWSQITKLSNQQIALTHEQENKER